MKRARVMANTLGRRSTARSREALRGAGRAAGGRPASAGSIPAASTAAAVVAAVAEYELRACVVTSKSRQVEMRVFASPQDAEGVAHRFSAREAQLIADAFVTPGFHAIARDDAPDPQLCLAL